MATPIVHRNETLKRIEKDQSAAIEAAVANVNQLIIEAQAFPVSVLLGSIGGNNTVVRNAVLERIRAATYRVEERYNEDYSEKGKEELIGYWLS